MLRDITKNKGDKNMKIIKALFGFFIILVIIGFMMSLFKSDTEPGQGNGGTLTDNTQSTTDNKIAFNTDFSAMRIQLKDGKYKLNDDILGESKSEIFYSDRYAIVEIKKEELHYTCTKSGSENIPSLKLAPVFGTEKLYLSEFCVVTVDFDIGSYHTPSEYSGYKYCGMKLDVRSESEEVSICADDAGYYSYLFNNGHYTLMYFNTEDLKTSRIFVFKDGCYEYMFNYYFDDTEYNGEDLYLSSLEIALPREDGDFVWVDNVDFRIYGKSYIEEAERLMNTDEPTIFSGPLCDGFTKWYEKYYEYYG